MHSSVHTLLGGLHVLIIINNALNMSLEILFQVCICIFFSSFQYISRSGIPELNSSSIFNVLRSPHTVFCRVVLIL